MARRISNRVGVGVFDGGPALVSMLGVDLGTVISEPPPLSPKGPYNG